MAPDQSDTGRVHVQYSIYRKMLWNHQSSGKMDWAWIHMPTYNTARHTIMAHLDIDTVKLIEAAPRAAASQALEKLGHSQVVQAVRAVEHNTLHKRKKRHGFSDKRPQE